MWRWCVVGAAVASFMACEKPEKKPFRLTLPPSTVQALTTGIPMMTVDRLLLSRITGASNGTIEFRQEWERAPAMTMVSLNTIVAANADDNLRPFISGLAPIERDFAFCGRSEVNDVELPVPTSSSYLLEPVNIGSNSDPRYIWLRRVGGSLTGLRITPDGVTGGTPFSTTFSGTGLEPNSFDLSVTASNLVFDFNYDNVPYSTSIASVAFSCKGVITNEAFANIPAAYAGCGEQNVRCAPGTTNVTISGLQTNFPGVVGFLAWIAGEAALRDQVIKTVEAGVTLHVQNYSPMALSFLNDGSGESWLHMVGHSTVGADGRSYCSPVPPPPPPEAPTRGLVNVWGTPGTGEAFSQNGYVKPFIVLPQVESNFNDGLNSWPLVARTSFDGQLIRGGEAAAALGLNVKGYATTLSKTEKFTSECWVKPARIAHLVQVPADRVYATLDGKFLKRSDLHQMLPRRLAITSFESADAAALEKLLNKNDLRCDEGCKGWTHVRGVLPRSNGEPWGPLDFPPGGPTPYDIDVWLEIDPVDFEHELGPQLKCNELGAAQAHEVGRRQFSLPTVSFYDALFDSVSVPSTDYVENTAYAGSFTRSTFFDGTKPQWAVTLSSSCAAGQPCWQGTLPAPKVGRVRLAVGHSDTVGGHLAIRDAIAGNLVPQYGSRISSVWGHFDRSAVEVFTGVPSAYRTAGITNEQWDYRGFVNLDWEHSSNFTEPNTGHVDFNRPLWNDTASGTGGDWRWYFANWSSDTVRVRRRPVADVSFCTLPQQLTAFTSEFEFDGAGVSNKRVLSRNLLVGGVRHSGGVVIEGNTALQGPTSVLFAP